MSSLPIDGAPLSEYEQALFDDIRTSPSLQSWQRRLFGRIGLGLFVAAVVVGSACTNHIFHF